MFEVEWKRSLFAAALAAFRADCEVRGKIRHCHVFESYYLAPGEPPSYAEIGRTLGIPVTDVTNSLHYARRQFRRFVLDTLRELCATDEELQLELESLQPAELFERLVPSSRCGQDPDDAARA